MFPTLCWLQLSQNGNSSLRIVQESWGASFLNKQGQNGLLAGYLSAVGGWGGSYYYLTVQHCAS